MVAKGQTRVFKAWVVYDVRPLVHLGRRPGATVALAPDGLYDFSSYGIFTIPFG